VTIQTIKDKTGKFGRYLAIIHRDGVNLNEKLVDSGCSRIELYDGKHWPAQTAITPDMKSLLP
jgi:endonuclease YncB( thermonuclease family)